MLVLTFFIGVLVNFIGYIPIGNINLTVMQMAINRGMRQVYYFLVTFAIIEFFFTFGIMKFAEWFAGESRLMHVLDYALIIVFLVMGAVTWKNHKDKPNKDYSKGDAVKLGILLGIINPMQIPFWMIGGTYLISHEWIETGNLALTIFSIGSGLGAFICLYGFARFARYIQNRFALRSEIINKSIAIVFFLLAAYHIIKMIVIALR